jgi:ribulose-phosphate 3-epimerase
MEFRAVEVEPSLYAGDFWRLGEQIEALLQARARVFHFDIGDGHFVEPVTIGPIVLQSISQRVHNAGGFLDCHLMTETPEKHFHAVARAGGDSVTVHYEAVDDLARAVRAARENQLRAGLAFKPETKPEDAVSAAVDAGVDLVLCMSIEPGYSGQPFMPEAFGRIKETRERLPENIPVQVDGGIGLENIGRARESGATLFVAGSSVFGGSAITQSYRSLVEAVT